MIAAGLVGVVGTTAIAAGGMGVGAAGAASSGPILVDAVAAETGTFGVYGSADIAGLRTQITLANKAGGVLGRKLKLQVVDDQSTAQKATVAIQKLLSSGPMPVAVWAGAVSVDTAAILPTTTRAKVVSFTAAATPTFVTPKKNPYNYVIFPSANDQVAGTAAALKKISKGKSKVGILYSNDTGGQAIAKAMQTSTTGLPSYGLTVVNSQSVSDTATDMTPQLQALQQAGAQAIFLQFASPAQFVSTMNDIQTMGWKVGAVAGTTAITQTVMGGVPAPVQAQFGALGTAPLARSSTTATIPSKTQTFIKQLAKTGGNTGTLLFSMNNADAINLLVYAMKQTKSATSLKVNAFLNKLGTNVPKGLLYQVPPPGFSPTNHGLTNGTFKHYWALLYAGKTVQGTYKGTVLPIK